MAVVTFTVDQYPYCKGDTVKLTAEELKGVDAEAERRGVKDTYSNQKITAPAAADESDAKGDTVKTETPKPTSAKK